MSNKPNYKHRVSLSEFKDKRIEEASVVIDLDPDDDGNERDPIVIPPPEMWPDRIPRGAVNTAKAIIGESEFERFVEAGGSAKILDAIFRDQTQQIQGVDPGKS